jgi:outer membrane protein
VGKYFFGSPSDQARPYVGFGVSRVSFHNIKTNQGDATVQALAGTSVDFSSAWAPVYNVGLIYKLDSKWSINGSMSYIPVKTTATFNGPGNPLVSSYPVSTVGDIKLNTMDYVIRLGYSF